MEESNYPLLNEKENQMIESDIKQQIYDYIREGFIHKVYSLLFVQLLITFGFVVLANEMKTIKIFVASHFWIYLILEFLPLAIVIFFICKQEVTRTVPTNYILLFIFSISFGYTIAYLTLKYPKKNVYFSMILTLVVVLVLSVYAFVTKRDFTMLGGLLWTCLVILIVVTILAYLLNIRKLYAIINAFGIILFSIYLIYDTQLVAGKGERKLSEDDYILGVIMIYLDIINIFLYILSSSGRK